MDTGFTNFQGLLANVRFSTIGCETWLGIGGEGWGCSFARGGRCDGAKLETTMVPRYEIRGLANEKPLG